MRRLWLLFSQATTIGLGLLFAVATLRPEWLPNRTPVVTLTESRAGSVAPQPGSLSAAAKKAMPAVVNIYTRKDSHRPPRLSREEDFFRRFFNERQKENRQEPSSLGSGVIVSAEGYILTNHHVVESADQIEVALADGRRLGAHIVGTDPETDLAVLRIEQNGLPSITFATTEPQVGESVLAIGNPFGVGQTVTSGIISALGRNHLGISTFENFIQTDAAINPGNSGGALVDANGHLIGINSAIYSRTGGSLGIGFAIPVSLARQVMEQIIQHGSVTRGWIGVEVQDITPELAETLKLPRQRGALIAGVLRDGPADKAEIKPGDVLLAIEGKPVNDSAAMLDIVAALPPGKSARLSVLREKTELQLPLTVGKRPKPRPR